MSYATSGTLISTSLAASMAVNALVTGLIVFKILRVFLKVKLSLGELTSGSTRVRRVIFVLIESGMALFAIQLIRIVVFNVRVPGFNLLEYVVKIQQVVNVIIRSVHN